VLGLRLVGGIVALAVLAGLVSSFARYARAIVCSCHVPSSLAAAGVPGTASGGTRREDREKVLFGVREER
jgi:hypothetical protein